MTSLRTGQVVAGAFALLVVAAGIWYWRSNQEPAKQGWTEYDRANWYAQSQGSRLLPYKWFRALEQPATTAKVSDGKYLASFGYLDAPAERNDGLPIGFAIDRQPDEDFIVTKLRWYADQRGDGASEPWLGLNCAACHTGELSYQGNSIRVDGGPALIDLQSFIESLDRALVETREDAEKFKRFAAEVLVKDDPQNQDMLRAALGLLIDWQKQAQSLSSRRLRYGYGRLDAFGQIFNKIEMFAGSGHPQGNPADAPVSFPFLWDTHRHKQVQWNGFAKNLPIPFLYGVTFDVGALGRNAAEALGVFAEVVVKPTDPAPPLPILKGNGPYAGYATSINVNSLQMFESVLTRLKAPEWPTFFPAIEPSKLARGEQLFKENCVTCHRTPDKQINGLFEEMRSIELTHREDVENNQSNLTDIWTACNIFTGKGYSGKLEGTKEDYVTASSHSGVLSVMDSMGRILGVATRGALVAKKGEVLRTAAATFLGIQRWQNMIPENKTILAVKRNQREENRTICTTTNDKVLSYKARPLDGIWATAPYLHNGSVPTLYHLLLPAKQRPTVFWTGSREYDPKYVGFVWDRRVASTDFEFRSVDAQGKPVDGDANIGHEYGAEQLTEADRWALVEYLKTL